MRYAILGSGAVGGLYGALLARHGLDVHFLLHSDFDHVQEHGLKIDSVHGDFTLDKPHIYRRVEDMPQCDVVIVALKSSKNELLKTALPQLVSEGGVVLSLQNGLDVEADCSSAVPGRGVLGGCCFLCSNKVGPGHIHHLDYGRIVFGVYDAASQPQNIQEMGQRILGDMIAAGIEAQWTDDLNTARWRKLMWNVPFNGLSVVLDAATNEIMDHPAARRLADTLIREVHRGAAVCGARIDDAAIEKTMQHTEQMVPYDSSMRLDFLHHRGMEVEAIFGNPLRAVSRAMKDSSQQTSKKPGHCMPSVEMLYQQLQFLDSRRDRMSNRDR